MQIVELILPVHQLPINVLTNFFFFLFLQFCNVDNTIHNIIYNKNTVIQYCKLLLLQYDIRKKSSALINTREIQYLYQLKLKFAITRKIHGNSIIKKYHLNNFISYDSMLAFFCPNKTRNISKNYRKKTQCIDAQKRSGDYFVAHIFFFEQSIIITEFFERYCGTRQSQKD